MQIGVKQSCFNTPTLISIFPCEFLDLTSKKSLPAIIDLINRMRRTCSNFQHFFSRTKITPTLVILIAYVHTQGQDTTQCEILHQTLLGAHHLSGNWRSVTNLPPPFNTAPDNQDLWGGTDWWRTLPNPESQLLMSRHVINYTTVFGAPVQHVAAWGWDFKNANLKHITTLKVNISLNTFQWILIWIVRSIVCFYSSHYIFCCQGYLF